MRVHTKIAVTGATGRLGRHVVDVLTARGHDVVPISRASGVDVITGRGLADALTGVDRVIDTATGASPDQRQATEFFVTAARNLHAAGERAGVERIVDVSIIGVDGYVGGYGAAKLAHEQALLAGPIPVSILRAAQFHELVAQMVEWGRQDDVVYVPRIRTQSVAARTVAEALVEMAFTPVAGNVAPFPEIAGPREEDLVEMAKLLVARRDDPVAVEGVSDLSDPDRALEEKGGLLPGPHARLAGPAFAEWLDATS